MNWFTALSKRLFLPTPDFFTKVVYFGITLGAIGAGILTLDNIPEWLTKVSSYMVTIGAVSAVIAKAAVKHPEAIK